MSTIATSVVSPLTTTDAQSASSALSTSTDSAVQVTPQGGVLEGSNPATYDLQNPIIIFIIQAIIIITFCRILHWPLSKIRQPRVIAEVIGGIILGPSVMMRIPGFQEAIFPTAANSNLNLVANIGLVLFLFLVGLEVNMTLFCKNWRIASAVGLAGMILPFGLGCAIAWGIYDEFRGDLGTVPISFGLYMLFIGTALSITAFPVLCRILTELKLLGTPVGVTVLAAGVANDVTGWILLALCVALVNNGSGLIALYVLLTCIGWILFLVFAVKPVFHWYLRRTGSIQNGPTQTAVCVTLVLVLFSAFFTAIIGVHPIFGAFVIGLICPHEGGFAIKLTEKIEDLVTVLFLPLYFAYSGLSTNIGLLNDAITWAYVIGIIAVAFAGKIVGGTLAAKSCKLFWRESFTIGVLMSCKGLVELIVLNIGLQAKILSTRTFTMFVVMALITTFATTPLVSFLYPPWYQKKLQSWKNGETDWDGNHIALEAVNDETSETSLEKLQTAQVQKLLVYLRLDSLPSLFTFINLMSGDRPIAKTKVHRNKSTLDSVPENGEAPDDVPKRPLEVHGLRILELTDRTSSVMKVSEGEYSYQDPVVNAFRTFAQLNNVAVSGAVSVVPEDSYTEVLNSHSSEYSSDLVLIPWSEPESHKEEAASVQDFSAHVQNTFCQKAIATATHNTAIFVNRGFGGAFAQEPSKVARTHSGISLCSNREAVVAPVADRSHHVYFPFFGGADDRAALRFVLQLALNSNVTLTVTHFTTPLQSPPLHSASGDGKQSEIDASQTSSGSKLDINERGSAMDLYSNPAQEDTALLHTLRDSLPAALQSRVVFADVSTTSPVVDCIDHAKQEIGQSPRNAGDLIVVGRGRHTSIHSSHSAVSPEQRKTLGIVAESIISNGVKGSVLVMHAGGREV
ncbi:Sodium/hydrogen exchanger family-domain-containing protein [Calycina marina]|uniref:Sodium/hydrogen exchanger family-domain-containing protein n=1 Tax=Calycina marina TaxID=1763456 RepID=A0A9P7Z570_9HELO|nr:Sodium/hydrogen exchanger family-domain-containing protein [Calycina marina]